MKKLICILLTLAMALSLAACGSSKSSEPSAPTPDTVFKYSGTEIPMGAKAEEVVKAIGKPVSVTEQPSCLGDGSSDKTYNYNGFSFMTMADADGDEAVFTLWFTDDTVFTTKGVSIGSPEGKVKGSYPDGYWCGSTCIIETEEGSLAIMADGGKVSDIRYTGGMVACPVC